MTKNLFILLILRIITNYLQVMQQICHDTQSLVLQDPHWQIQEMIFQIQSQTLIEKILHTY